MRSLLTPLGESAPPEIRVEILGPERRLDRSVEHHLLRIAQEAVTNARKHARAAHITVTLEFTAGLTLRITDDGEGFDVTAGPVDNSLHFGLLGMRERAGKISATLDLQSAPGKGTTVQVTLARV
jgi:signal transduction histidine kinase